MSEIHESQATDRQCGRGVLALGRLRSAPAWASYGGGACHSCTPAPVIATQFQVASLAPRVETVYQTVYETVYVNEPVTVMETRYRMAYRTENYTVMRPVTETVVRRTAVHGDQAGLSDGQRGTAIHA